MNAKLLALILCVLPSLAAAQGFAGLADAEDGFTLPQPDPVFEFPKDHGAHPNFRIEWWYVTANLQDAEGRQYGAQWTLFRSALRPETDATPATTPWDSRQIWFAHAALTSAENHFVAERFARGGIGQAGARAQPFEAWIDDWAMTQIQPDTQDGLDRLRLTARGNDFAYRLDLSAEGPLVFQGDGGYSVKSELGQASYYYSQPHYRVAGQISLEGQEIPVTGQAWLDREWSSQPLAETQSGWDWFALHFDSGWKLMVYRLRDAENGDYIPATRIAPDGTTEAIPPGEITLTPLRHTRINGRRIPTEWRVTWPRAALDITTKPLNPKSWMGTNIAYWEGPVFIEGSETGRGYLEMTGHE